VDDLVPPDDLVALKAAWYAARDRAQRLTAVEPVGDQTIPRTPLTKNDADAPVSPIRLLSEEQSTELNTASAEEVELTLRLHRHPWKREQSYVHEAERTLNEAALTLWRCRAAEFSGAAARQDG
jgi:hypothetical protein